MRLIKISLAAAMLIGASAFAEDVNVDSDTASDIEVSANVALASNYVWRGMTQSDNSPAIQGGFDLGFKGLYAGVWGSNVEFGTDASVELDVYAGYANEVFGIGYDVGYIQYTYPNDSEALNFGEAYIALSYDFKVVAISGMYYLGIETNDGDPEDGYELGVSVPLPWEMAIDGTFGDYNNIGMYYSASLTKTFGKFDLSVAYTGMEYDDSSAENEDNVVATIGASF